VSTTREKLTFNDFSGYYGVVPDGYGGFDWTDIDYFNNGGGAERNEEGFQSAIKGRGEAGFGGDWGGSFESANLSESFSLKSMLVASGDGSAAPITFTSFTYSNGELTEKAHDVFHVTPQVQRIDFSELGGKGDFQNIAAVYMSIGSARYASHYGHDPVGDGMVFDNMIVQWNGGIPDGKLIPSHRAFLSPHITHALAANPGLGAVHADGSSPAAAGDTYHSALTSLDAVLGHAGTHGGLTGQFVLPEPDHFGA